MISVHRLKSILLHMDPQNLAINLLSFIQFQKKQPALDSSRFSASRNVHYAAKNATVREVCDSRINSLHRHFRGPRAKIWCVRSDFISLAQPGLRRGARTEKAWLREATLLCGERRGTGQF